MLSGTHGYFKAQGYESCPECGACLLAPVGDGQSRDGGQDQPQAIGPDSTHPRNGRKDGS